MQVFYIIFSAIILFGIVQLYLLRQSLERVVFNFWLIIICIGLVGLLISISFEDMPLLFAIIGIIVAIFLPVFIERISRPSLKLDNVIIEPVYWNSNGNSERYCAVGIGVIHPKLPDDITGLWADLWLERRVASRCRGTIQFITQDGHNSLPLPPMQIRWANSLQPTCPYADIELAGKKGHVYKLVNEVDIAPGDSNKIDIVAQFDGDPHCYGWNNESYSNITEHKAPRNPTWKLPPDRYLVKVQVFYADKVLNKTYNLFNSGTKDGLNFDACK